MKKLLLIFLILAFLTSGCAIGKNRGNKSSKLPQTPHEEEKEEDKDPLKEKISQMNIDEKIGQMVIVGLEGYEIDENSQEMIDKYKVGGFILFKRNIQSAEQTLNLINSLKKANKSNKVPLFIAVDEEGGRVSRMPDEFLKLPTSRAVGKINSEEFAHEIGKTIGWEIKSLGFNMNFAPVLDIDSNPKNPVIGDRSFGTTPEIVSSLGIAAMKGLKNYVISVVKHFPGHGDTSVDSHVGLPVINHDKERLESFELIPFARAIENGVDAIMIAHILLPKIDDQNPATFSKTLITDILRNKMNFDGVVITDDMTMGAIVENYDIGEAAVKSVLAGADIVLVCHDSEKQIEVLEALKQAVIDGVIPESTVDEHVYRVLKLKQKYDLKDEIKESVDVQAINEKIEEVVGKY